MGYPVRNLGSGYQVAFSLNGRTVDIQAIPSPGGDGSTSIFISELGPTGEAFAKLVLAELVKLAASLDIKEPSLVKASNFLSRIELSWVLVSKDSAKQLLEKLAEFFNSARFAEALQKSQEGQNG